ncbi:FtsX-like permease family protein [Streptomyces sp. ME19-01-6]|uniref:FtsX-like permease family protein n=1 Tax=Streptomyces sp. ME19-01-6 TaxID=3028686 RepID=UPI0029BD3C39|nr:FtsX-like permease family protein [Streptomyces sp. ME19-01-6]MDX3228456.1 ABC transporter permease [Streptomyces sp. ME19-01-6]
MSLPRSKGEQGGAGAERGGVRVTALLASRAARTHRKAWAAVFAALALTSLLLGSFVLALASAGLGHARVERYAAADLVVTGDQETRFTAKPWGSDPQTARAGLTERVRVPGGALGVVRKVPGVREAVADEVFQVGRAGEAVTGRAWDAARLAPYELRDGRAPRAADEIVVGGGARPGERITLRVSGADAAYTVVGTADGPRAAVYFEAAEARRLAGHPGTLDAIGVLAEPGVGTDALYSRVRHALDAAGIHSVGRRADGDSAKVRVLTGNGRGGPEFLAVAPARAGMLELLASVAATVVLIALLVVSSTVVQALRQRSHELGLLRAVGAMPRQLRGAVGREVGRVAAFASLLGAAAALPAYAGLRGLLEARGALPPGLELPLPPWLWPAPLVTAGITVLIARAAAWIACARAAKLRPAEALREPAPGTPRRITGLVLLALGAGSAGTAVLQSGQAAAMAAGTAAVTMVIGCALLGPWIATGAMRVLGAPLRRFGGPGGRLAAANCTASATRLGAALTPIILVTAFAAVQLAGGATLTHAGQGQAREAMRADLAVRADGGLPGGAVERIRDVPGVRAATDVVHGTVVLARREAGEPRLDRLPVLGVTPKGLPHTLDSGVRDGSLRALRPGTVAVGGDRARSLDARPGSTVTLRFGDGTEAKPRVVAVYERSLALGDFLLSRDELLAHTTMPGPGRVLVTVAPGADRAAVARALAAAVPGARVEQDPAPIQVEPEDQTLVEVVTVAAVSAIGAFTVIAVLSTLSLITIGRRPELRLLRLAGAGRRQLRRMLRLEAAATAVTGLAVGAAVASVPLLAFSVAMARTVPYLPPVQGLVIVAVVAVTAAAGTLAPSWAALRGRYPGASPSGG